MTSNKTGVKTEKKHSYTFSDSLVIAFNTILLQGKQKLTKKQSRKNGNLNFDTEMNFHLRVQKTIECVVRSFKIKE